jgi:hypothetical protein
MKKSAKRSTLYATRKQLARLEAANDIDGELMRLWFAAHRSSRIALVDDRAVDCETD